MKSFLFILACFLGRVIAQYGYQVLPVLLNDSQTGRIRGFSNIDESDFYLAGLTQVHFDTRGVKCSANFSDRGVEETEAMLFAIDSINNDPNLLPNITLGYDIRDYCGVENVAIDDALEWALTSSIATASQECTDVNSNGSVLAAVIGAYHSRVSGPVASLLRPFEIPQISYGSTSPVLSNRLRYSYFFRTVPPDNLRSDVVVSIILSQGWNVVSAVHSNELFGEFLIEEFRTLANNANICLDLDEGINEDFTDSDYAQLAQKIYSSSTRVVLVFTLEMYVEPFLKAINNIQPRERFVWIAASWAESFSIQEEFGDALVGMLGVAPFAPVTADFINQYYRQLTPSNNIRDPYFRDYCTSFLSNMDEVCTNDTSIANSTGYTLGTFSSFMIEAVYSAAYGLHNFLQENCDSSFEWNRTTQSCKGQNLTLNSSVLFDYISRVNFTVPGTENRVAFNNLGNPEVAEYNVFNFQKMPNGENVLKKIGTWDSVNDIKLDSSKAIQFGLKDDGSVLLTFESQCKMCKSGEIKQSFQASCCSLCDPCTDDMYANSSASTECLQCGTDMWGNNPLNGSDGCVPLREVYLSFNSGWGIAVIVFAVIGFISVTSVSVLIALLWTNAVVKSFGREQLILILIGLALCFIFPFLYVFRPSVGLCVVRRLGFWFSLTMILASLLVKLIRVTRIFLGGLKTSGRYFVKPWHQVVFTFFIIGGQMVLVVISIIVNLPNLTNTEMETNTDDEFPILIVTCVNPHTAMLVLLILYDTVLVILINGFAIFTIRFPKNFKEARNIAFATFAIGVVWLALVPLYLTSKNEFRAGFIAFGMMCVAFSILVCLILPRLYIAFLYRNINTTNSQQSKELERSLKGLSADGALKPKSEANVPITKM